MELQVFLFLDRDGCSPSLQSKVKVEDRRSEEQFAELGVGVALAALTNLPHAVRIDGGHHLFPQRRNLLPQSNAHPPPLVSPAVARSFQQVTKVPATVDELERPSNVWETVELARLQRSGSSRSWE